MHCRNERRGSCERNLLWVPEYRIKQKLFTDKNKDPVQNTQHIRLSSKCVLLTDNIISIALKASGRTNSHYHEDNLLLTVVNLFTAGTDTTASTLRFALLLMAKYPKIQGKTHQDLFMGNCAHQTMSDLSLVSSTQRL